MCVRRCVHVCTHSQFATITSEIQIHICPLLWRLLTLWHRTIVDREKTCHWLTQQGEERSIIYQTQMTTACLDTPKKSKPINLLKIECERGRQLASAKKELFGWILQKKLSMLLSKLLYELTMQFRNKLLGKSANSLLGETVVGPGALGWRSNGKTSALKLSKGADRSWRALMLLACRKSFITVRETSNAVPSPRTQHCQRLTSIRSHVVYSLTSANATWYPDNTPEYKAHIFLHELVEWKSNQFERCRSQNGRLTAQLSCMKVLDQAHLHNRIVADSWNYSRRGRRMGLKR